MKFKYDDGGRAEAGYKGTAGDCVVRSIAIATGLPYQKVYDDLNLLCKPINDKRVKKGKEGTGSSREGVWKDAYQAYLRDLGWTWVPTMKLGQGCKVHLKEDELPKGTLIVRVSKHMLCVKDGVVHDTYNDHRDGTRCVYGYFYKPEEEKKVENVEEISPDTVKKVVELQAIRSKYKWLKRDLENLERQARKVLKDDITSDVFGDVEKTLNMMEKQVEDFKERTEREKKEKEEAHRNKTLTNAIAKVQAAGFDVAVRPKIFFGTTEDHSYRVICMGPEGKDGKRFTVYWSGGATWSDRAGTHYGESTLYFTYTTMEKGYLKKPWNDKIDLRSVREHLNGGRMSIERLKKVEDFIKQYIPNYVPLLVPATHLVVYN